MDAVTMDTGIELLDGTMFSYTDPDPSNVSSEMLAHILSHINRFAGHTLWAYSVAQHSYNASLIVAPQHALTALLHDTAEAFTNDLPTPLKHALPGIKDIESRIEQRMAEKFGTQFPLPWVVKLADLQMLGIEKAVLKPSASHWRCLNGIEYEHLFDVVNLDPLSPLEARDLFLGRYEELAR